jgi:alcohol dehydrogenase class IV
MMGATAFQKGLGGVHALAHPLGAVYDAHHGLLNAILLPYVLVRNRDAIGQKVADLADLLSLQYSTFDGFIDWIVELRAQLNIQHDLSSIVGDESRVAEVARLATEDAASAGNPLFLSAEDYSQVLTNAIRGDL